MQNAACVNLLQHILKQWNERECLKYQLFNNGNWPGKLFLMTNNRQKQMTIDSFQVPSDFCLTDLFPYESNGLQTEWTPSGLNQRSEKGDNTAIKLFYFIFLISDIYVCLLLLSNISNVSNWLDLSSQFKYLKLSSRKSWWMWSVWGFFSPSSPFLCKKFCNP